jgi:outer membrane protein OmpA-like peptidoglycan-associated protein
MSSKRVIAKGYGESKHIAPNENPDGTDNPEGRQMNRRIELTIIGVGGEQIITTEGK